MRHQCSRRRKTTMKRYGRKFYKEIGSIGGNNNSTKFTSETGRIASNKRWQTYRKLNSMKGVYNVEQN
jgi:hypothetical protein